MRVSLVLVPIFALLLLLPVASLNSLIVTHVFTRTFSIKYSLLRYWVLYVSFSSVGLDPETEHGAETPT